MTKSTEFFLNTIAVKGIVANGYIGSVGQALMSNGTSTYWGSGVGYTGSRAYTYTGATPPVSALDGDTWWDPETGNRYVYYVDVDTSQWVQDSAVGPAGFIGYTGSAGAYAAVGYTGSQGVTGYSGATGYTGSLGYTGSQGYTGSIGYTGSAGVDGYTGSIGSVGYTGSYGRNSAQLKTTTYTASFGDVIAANTFTAAFSISLPPSPTTNQLPIVVFDGGANSTFNGFATNNLTILRNSSATINGVADDVFFADKGMSVILEYMTAGWRMRLGG